MVTKDEESRQINDHYYAKKVLVTGGFGFVGSHVVKQLVEYGATVTALDLDTTQTRDSLLNDKTLNLREKIQVALGNLTDREFVREIVSVGKFHSIFHFAAYATVIERAVENPYDTIQANTMGLVNLLEAARLIEKPHAPQMIFFASTDKVYGETEGEEYQEEKTPLRGIGVYDAAKLAADVFARTYHEVFGLPTVVLRMCNLFGPHDYNVDFRLIPKAMQDIYGNNSPKAPELYFDSIEHSRDYLYIDDAVRAILLLGYKYTCRGEVYNLPACKYISTPEILKVVIEVAAGVEQKNGNRELAEAILENGMTTKGKARKKEVITIKKQHLNGEKIKQATGFEPTVEFKAALEETVSFYRGYFSNKKGGV